MLTENTYSLRNEKGNTAAHNNIIHDKCTSSKQVKPGDSPAMSSMLERFILTCPIGENYYMPEMNIVEPKSSKTI